MLNVDGPEKPSKIAGFAIIEASKPGTRSPENRKRYGRPRFYSRFYSPAAATGGALALARPFDKSGSCGGRPGGRPADRGSAQVRPSVPGMGRI